MLSTLALGHVHGRETFVGHGVNHVLRHLDAPPPTNATTHFYKEAVLDHASPISGSDRHWRQRYYTDQTHWCGEGCPIFVYIGGEGPQGPVSPKPETWA